MGNYITTALMICNRERTPEVAAFATELTKKASMDEMGFDLTDPANQNDARSFRIYENRCLCWDDYTSYPTHLNVDKIIDKIVHHFPEIEFIHEECWEGPVYFTEHIKGDYREEYVRRTLDIGVDDPEAFTRLADALNVRQSYPFFIFPLGDLPVSRVEPEIDSIIERVSKIVPDQKLYCIQVNNLDYCDCYSKKGIVEDGKINWHQISSDENDVMDKTIESMEIRLENKPNEDVLKCLFDDSFRDEILALIARAAVEELDYEDDLPF